MASGSAASSHPEATLASSDWNEIGRSTDFVHTCCRITDPEKSIAFYEALGFEMRRELPIRDEAINYFLGIPGKEMPELELTYNVGVDSYELGTAYGRIALTIENMEETLAALAEKRSSRNGRRTQCAKGLGSTIADAEAAGSRRTRGTTHLTPRANPPPW